MTDTANARAHAAALRSGFAFTLADALDAYADELEGKSTTRSTNTFWVLEHPLDTGPQYYWRAGLARTTNIDEATQFCREADAVAMRDRQGWGHLITLTRAVEHAYVVPAPSPRDGETKAPSAVSAEEREPDAWLHIMHMEGDQTSTRVTLDDDNPWGEPGKDYSATYEVTTEPLYATPAPTPPLSAPGSPTPTPRHPRALAASSPLRRT